MTSETLAAIAILGALVSVLCLLKQKNTELRRELENEGKSELSRPVRECRSDAPAARRCRCTPSSPRYSVKNQKKGPCPVARPKSGEVNAHEGRYGSRRDRRYAALHNMARTTAAGNEKMQGVDMRRFFRAGAGASPLGAAP